LGKTTFVGIVLGALLACAPAVARDRLTLAGSEWCPYACAHEAPVGLGYMVDIAKATFEPDVKIDYTLVNWARAVDEAKVGKLDALVGSSKRDGLVFTKEALGVAQNAFAVRRDDSFEFKGVESLKGRALGVVNGYSYTDEIDAYVATHTSDAALIQTVSGDQALTNNLRKLAAKRVDLVVDDVNVLRTQIESLGLGEQLKIVPGGEPDPIYIAFSAKLPDAQALADRLDTKLAEMRASGALTTILARYKLTDWKN